MRTLTSPFVNLTEVYCYSKLTLDIGYYILVHYSQIIKHFTSKLHPNLTTVRFDPCFSSYKLEHWQTRPQPDILLLQMLFESVVLSYIVEDSTEINILRPFVIKIVPFIFQHK